MVGEAAESAISAVASPFLLVATGIDTGMDVVCAGGAIQVSIPVVRQNPVRPRNQQVVSASTSSYLV
jgi:hypothetical protein